jgi:hypothetical protein
MREIRLYGSEGGGSCGSPYPIPERVQVAYAVCHFQLHLSLSGDLRHVHE